MAETQEGFIFLWRCFTKTSFYRNPIVTHLAVHLLLKANHEKAKFVWNSQKVTLLPGQLITGREALAKSSSLTSQNVRTGLKILKNCGFLTIKSTNKFSIITICNYMTYQKNGKHVNQLSNQQLTNSQPTELEKLTTNNNNIYKKEEEGEPQPPSFSSFLKTLKTNPQYSHIDIDSEMERIDEWLSKNPNKRKTRPFIINWLNRIEIPFEISDPRSDFEKYCQKQGVEA